MKIEDVEFMTVAELIAGLREAGYPDDARVMIVKDERPEGCDPRFCALTDIKEVDCAPGYVFLMPA